MTFKLRAIHLYSRDASKEPRSLRFNPEGLNIITGASATGKSSILEIVDYCLGSRSFNVAVGVIRDTVDLYAVELDTAQGVFVCARSAPLANRANTTTMYIGPHADDESTPRRGELAPNFDIDSARTQLSDLANIEENATDIGDGSRRSFSANIRHSLFFTFQSQSEVASRDVLFHSQGEEWVPQAIRDAIPYFLGAIDPAFMRKQEQLRAIQRELRILRRLAAEEDGLAQVPGRAVSLLRECQALNMLPGDIDSTQRDAVLVALSDVLETPAEAPEELDQPDIIRELLARRETLRGRLGELRSETDNLRSLLAAHTEYRGEAIEHVARLQTADLLRTTMEDGVTTCPTCDSTLADPIPGVQEMRQQLEQLSAQITTVRQNAPTLQRLIGENEAAIQGLGQDFSQNQRQIRDAFAAQQQLAQLRDLAISRASIRGRVSLYLESLPRAVERTFSAERLAALEREAAQLQGELDSSGAESRVESALSRVASHMGDVARLLSLEYADSPVRLDLRRLTVVVDRAAGPSPLGEIGSAANWLGYHLATLLGLHRYFLESSRPVPSFLMLDQPSQVYYPQDPGLAESTATDEDNTAVERIFRVLLETATSTGLQIIVLDHASLGHKWFQSAVIEQWRDGRKLIPSDWLDDATE